MADHATNDEIDEIEANGNDEVVKREKEVQSQDASPPAEKSALPPTQNGAALEDSVLEKKSSEVDDEAKRANEDKDEDGWLDVLGSAALRKKVLRPGKGVSSRPRQAQKVTTMVEERLEDGTVVKERQEVVFYLNEGEVIQALDMIVCLMEVDEISLVESESRFAYGSYGLPPKVAPDSKLILEIELVKVEMAAAAFDQTLEEFVGEIECKRLIGNDLYKRKEYTRAVDVYKKAIDRLDSTSLTKDHSADSEEKLVKPLKIACLNNCAAAYLQLDLLKEAEGICDQVIKIDPQNAKAHFRRGKALSSRGDVDEALQSFQEAQKLEPNDSVILRHLRTARNESVHQNQKQKVMYTKMMDGLKKEKDQEPITITNKTAGSWLNWTAVMLFVGALGAVASIWWVRSS